MAAKIVYINKEARYWELFHKTDKTQAEEKEFSDLCDVLLLELLEKNRDVFCRLKDR